MQLRSLVNPAVDPGHVAEPSGDAAPFHAALPGYRPTPVRELDAVACELRLAAVTVKDESDRLGGAMNRGLESLKDTKTVLLTTYKRDGTPIDTPVSIAFTGERAFFRSLDRACKTKRLCNNPRLEVAPATRRGKPTGPPIRARATLLSDQQAKLAAERRSLVAGARRTSRGND